MEIIQNIDLDGKIYKGYLLEIGSVPLIIIKAKNGYIACSYIDLQTAERVGDAVGIVKGVRTFNDMLKARIISVTKKAKEFGVMEGMEVPSVLKLLD